MEGLRALVDYGKSKNIVVIVEPRSNRPFSPMGPGEQVKDGNDRTNRISTAAYTRFHVPGKGG